MSSYTSVAAVQEQQHANPEAFLKWDINFPPHINPEQLHLNTTAIRIVGKIAGFSEVFFDEHVGDQTAFEPPAIGGSSGDSAIAAWAFGHSKRAPLSNPSLEVTRGADLPYNYRTFRGVVSVNKPELTSRIATRTRNGQESSRAWQHELDDALREGLRKAARRSLIGQASILAGVTGSGLPCNFALLPRFGEDAILSTVVLLGAWGYGHYFAEEIKQNRQATGKANFSDRRWSISPTPTFAPDRYAVACLISTLPLVRYRQ